MNSKGRGEPVTAAERMRAHRSRRRNGLRCVRLLLHETEIDRLKMILIVSAMPPGLEPALSLERR